LTPLSQRWMPPQKVIEIFEEQGFIWGGKWGIWDNMHFEYRPELIIFQKQNR
ncbi:MAG: M15 family metallopeptidase, partial [Spirochaetaceae bacterium]|nr:M15 family metallopeptidase [Spirochaetaceae bacterium]